MNREQYLKMRKTGQYDLGWFYQYYMDNRDTNKQLLDFQVFTQTFNMFFQMNSREVLEQLDKKLDVTKIEDQQGQIIYIN